MLRLDLTDDVHLRYLEPSDAEELNALINANRAYLSRWMAWAADHDLAAARSFIDLTRTQLAENNGLQTAIVERGEIVGVTGFHGVDWRNRSTSLGYWLAEDRQGRGTMTRAVHALVGHAFTAWKLNRAEIRAAPENLRSQAIPVRLGFTREGVLRQAELVGDAYLDSVVYGVLASDWPPNRVA
jgi:ribosomal-protein-serine acetyltransferase